MIVCCLCDFVLYVTWLIYSSQASLEEGYTGYLGKVDLQNLAQPLSDQPFAVRNAHSEFYTAWSGVRSVLFLVCMLFFTIFMNARFRIWGCQIPSRE
jgi:hypothetical protein